MFSRQMAEAQDTQLSHTLSELNVPAHVKSIHTLLTKTRHVAQPKGSGKSTPLP